jgi:hypothetical protein
VGYYWVRSTWVRSSSAAQSLDVFGHCDRFDAIWIIGVLGTKSAHLATLAQHSVSAHHHVLLHKDFGAPSGLWVMVSIAFGVKMNYGYVS